MSLGKPTAILLAAGRGQRFLKGGGDGNKLLALLPDGRTVAETSATTLREAGLLVVAMIRHGEPELRSIFERLGCQIIECERADEGMGSVIATAIAQTASDSCGWLIALADMPWLQAGSLAALLAEFPQHELIAPVFEGRRGHPVIFRKSYEKRLSELRGDIGASNLIAKSITRLIAVNDSGVVRDVDQPADLH